MSFRYRLLSSTFIPIVVSFGAGIVVVPCAPRAASKSSYLMAAACNPCNPCAAKNPCSPCNPCAAACNPCNPCAAACNPCNPCAAAGGATKCVVPRLQMAAACNPCAAKACNPCNPCNPCAAKACNPCNPCAAKACNPCNPCNPCAAKACNPCNPCNPCAAAKACNPCNPCAAKACNPCNPCNPCAAKACNPCNPCAAACNPCNPCAAAAAVELTDAEATAAYDCVKGALKAGYAKSGLTSDTGLAIAANFQGWQRYSTRPYVSDTHGGRFVQNYGNAIARNYRKYEDAGKLPAGSVLAKDSFVLRGGKVSAGPLFVMEKMPGGFSAESANWRYTMVMPNGKIIGTTNGQGTKNVKFCIACHKVLSDNDSLFFVPDEYRVKF